MKLDEDIFYHSTLAHISKILEQHQKFINPKGNSNNDSTRSEQESNTIIEKYEVIED